jgi:hypothetical protein
LLVGHVACEVTRAANRECGAFRILIGGTRAKAAELATELLVTS